MLILEIAAGVILGLVVFGWLRRVYQDWQNRAALRGLEEAKRIIARGMPQRPD